MEEEKLLCGIINRGKARHPETQTGAAVTVRPAILMERTGMQRRSVEALRQRFVEEEFETTLEGKPRGHRPRTLAGEDAARLTALVCGPVPEGRAFWTVRL
jgi:hypothetical protein